MRLKQLSLNLIAALGLFSCACGGTVSGPETLEKEEGQPSVPAEPADPAAKTAALLDNLSALRAKGILFGAQIPTEYGLSGGEKWWDDGSVSTSDTKNLTGSHPAVCGWDISEIELNHSKNIDGEPFETIRKHIRAAYGRGAVNTISWHCANPVTGGNSWDNTPAVHEMLPGGSRHKLFKEYLDRVAAFFYGLTTEEGDLIPLIFRPWHEHTGNGFWWGKGSAEAADFAAMWRFTVDYLRKEKGLYNLLFAYSPDAIHFIWNPESDWKDIYLEFWPGDEYVDILGLDAYDAAGRRFSQVVPVLCKMVSGIAEQKGKIAALTEAGIENNNPAHSSYTNARWWTEVLYPAIHGAGLSFAMVWRNGGLPPDSHYFNAYKGCYSEADFKQFASREDILLERDLPKMYEKNEL